MNKTILFFVGISIFFAQAIYAQIDQPKDQAQYIPYVNQFYSTIVQSLGDEPLSSRTVMKADASHITFPQSVDEFTTVWCQDPVSQGRTGTCWCYSTSSFYESEIYRKTQQEIKLSELYLVYFEYLAKAEEYIQTKGTSFLGEGSETNALARQMKKHGLMPASAYEGNQKQTAYHDHSQLFKEFKAYLKDYKKRDAWDKEMMMAGVKAILNHYLGAPPKTFYFNRKAYDPISFMRDIAQINPEMYVNVMSLKEKPYWQKAEYDVPDNYWNSQDYLNVPLKDFMNGLKSALKNGYSVSIGGDVSETGILPDKNIAFVPSYDIPSEYIDENARQMRFSNGSTTDDHAMHAIGYKEMDDGKWWFLVKDSGSSSRNGPNQGYYFIHEDYVKLKMMSYTVNRNGVQEIVKKF